MWLEMTTLIQMMPWQSPYQSAKPVNGFLILSAPIICVPAERFLDFKEFIGGVVYMGNDSTYKMMGIDLVQIKMFDGVIWKLNDVRYVLDLKKNLISLGVLDANGYRIILKGGNLKVARGAYTTSTEPQ